MREGARLQKEAIIFAQHEGNRDLLATLTSYLNLGMIKSMEGDHCEALCMLEGLAPMVRLASTQYPLYFYFYHNALAVELGELGRIQEANAALSIALASPFASSYPEWT